MGISGGMQTDVLTNGVYAKWIKKRSFCTTTCAKNLSKAQQVDQIRYCNM